MAEEKIINGQFFDRNEIINEFKKLQKIVNVEFEDFETEYSKAIQYTLRANDGTYIASGLIYDIREMQVLTILITGIAGYEKYDFSGQIYLRQDSDKSKISQITWLRRDIKQRICDYKEDEGYIPSNEEIDAVIDEIDFESYEDECISRGWEIIDDAIGTAL